MTLEKAVEFLKKAETDAELKAKLHAGEMAADEAVKLAANMGYTFTVAELNDAMDEVYGELSDEELENAAGGLGSMKPPIRFD